MPFCCGHQPVDEGVYWSINYDKFHQRFHDKVLSYCVLLLTASEVTCYKMFQAIVSAVAERIDEVYNVRATPIIVV